MSLRLFHIFFIVISIALMLGFGVWEMRHFMFSARPAEFFMSVGSFAVCLSLVVYLFWFIQKKLR